MTKKEKKLTKSQSQSVPSEMMIIQLQVIGGGPSEIQKVSQYMNKFSENNKDLNMRFIVSNDHIELRSVDWLIAELMKLKEMENKENE